MSELIDKSVDGRSVAAGEREPLPELADDDLRNSPFGLLLQFSSMEPVASSAQLQEKILRIFHTVSLSGSPWTSSQALHAPALSNAQSKLTLTPTPESKEFFMGSFEKLIVVSCAG